MIATIVIVLLMASISLLATNPKSTSVQAQNALPPGVTPTNNQPQGSIPLPSGVTPDVTIPTKAYVTVSPNPVGIGQPLLVNMWMNPALQYHYFTGFAVTFTKPGGATDKIGPLDSYPADTTAWFNYYPDTVGDWTYKFDFPGGYYPAGNYTIPVGAWTGGEVLNLPLSAYYQPSSDGPYHFTVQQQQVQIGPPNWALPTGYWSRPIASDLRSWSGLAGGGDWVYSGSFGDFWRPDGLGNNQVNPYSAGPNSAHIVWLKKATPGGMAGGPSGPIADPTFPMINIIISGIGYYQLNGLHAVDMQTGEELWVNTASTPGSFFASRVSMWTISACG